MVRREETILRAEYGVNTLSDGNLKNEVENVKRKMFLEDWEGTQPNEQVMI